VALHRWGFGREFIRDVVTGHHSCWKARINARKPFLEVLSKLIHSEESIRMA
jgi:hypothetical protein